MNRKPITSTLAHALAAGVLLLSAAAAQASPPERTREDFAMLPEWCKATQINMDMFEGGYEQFKRNMERYGPDWNHMHHYCWALWSTSIYYRASTPRVEKNGLLSDALNDLDYTLRNTKPGFAFRPDMYDLKIRLLQHAKDLKRATKAAEAYVDEWPANPRPYILLARLLQLQNAPEKAKQVLRQGDEKVEDKEVYAKMRSEYGMK